MQVHIMCRAKKTSANILISWYMHYCPHCKRNSICLLFKGCFLYRIPLLFQWGVTIHSKQWRWSSSMFSYNKSSSVGVQTLTLCGLALYSFLWPTSSVTFKFFNRTWTGWNSCVWPTTQPWPPFLLALSCCWKYVSTSSVQAIWYWCRRL